MKLLISLDELDKMSSRQMCLLECECCNRPFMKNKHLVQAALKGNGRLRFCSIRCRGNSQITIVQCRCRQCNERFGKRASEAKKGPNHFCSSSCAATFNNTHKTKGTRRSKLEVWLEQELTKEYPLLEIHYMRKDAIDSELDIYVPSLGLAFELNGIFHYEPIYGQEKLIQIQNNDTRKYQACLERGIEICVIDSSGLKYFKADRAQRYLDIVTKLIDSKMVVLPRAAHGHGANLAH